MVAIEMRIRIGMKIGYGYGCDLYQDCVKLNRFMYTAGSASSQSLMATIGETLMVEKATGKRVAKHQAVDHILYQYIYHDTRATYKWYRKYSVKFKPLLHLSF